MTNAGLDKAVIMARGLGSRMRSDDQGDPLDPDQAAVADAGVKALIRIDRPFLDYVLSALADANIRRVCLVIGPEHNAIRDYYTREVELKRIQVEFAIQEIPDGTAHAVAAAEAFAGTDQFLVLNSDNYYPVQVLRTMVEAAGFALPLFNAEALSTDSNIAADCIARYAVGCTNADGILTEIIEKPDPETLARLPEPYQVSMNLWRFGPAIFEACRKIERSPRDEFELIDAVKFAMEHLGVAFQAIPVSAPVLDLTSRADIAPVAARLSGTSVQL